MKKIFYTAVSVLAISSTTSALAQTDNAQAAPGEIVVTATRHAEPLSKVPLSVSAFSGEMLDRRGIKDLSGLVRQTSGSPAGTLSRRDHLRGRAGRV